MAIADKLTQIANNVPLVYNAGYQKGISEGGGDTETAYNQGVEAGKQAEREAFWVPYQSGGERTDCAYAFAGIGWTDQTFNPEFDMSPIDAQGMFTRARITDLKGILERTGKSLDFSKSTTLNYCFMDSTITSVGIFDTRKANVVAGCFNGARALISIEKIILKSDGSQTFNTLFQNAEALASVAFEGVIGKAISFANSPNLNAESVQNTIDHLADLRGATAQTITFHQDVRNNLTTAQENAIELYNWTLLPADKTNV